MDKNCQQNYQAENNIPIVCAQEAGKLLIQLEGSHTTATTTESPPSSDKKNVKFKDAKDGQRQQEVDAGLHKKKIAESINTDFGKITKQEDIELRLYGQAFEEAKQISKFRCISTATAGCDTKNIACQTQPCDVTSLNELSLLEISSLTSRSEQANSLNNYAQAENACVSNYGSQQEIMKPLSLPADISELPRTASVNIITIETEATPSPTALRRAPLCRRLWDVFCDYCAVTFLCLQVNRDCIYCLSFFAAFVVSASFLTAFFYHTLATSPALWQTAENSYF